MKVAGGKDETCLQREPHPTSSSQLIVSVTSKIVRGSTKYHFEFIHRSKFFLSNIIYIKYINLRSIYMFKSLFNLYTIYFKKYHIFKSNKIIYIKYNFVSNHILIKYIFL